MIPMEPVKAGSTSQIIEFDVFDSSSTTGARLTGLVYNTASLTAYYSRQNAVGAWTQISLATMTKGTWASGGFVASDGTNSPGCYQLGLPDAALASAAGVNYVQVVIKGAANMVPVHIRIPLWGNVPKDIYDVVAHSDYGNAKLVRSTTPANPLDVSATGEAGLDFANVKAAASPTTLTNVTVPIVTTLTSAPGDSTGITTLLARIVGTLAAGTHSPQSGDAYAAVVDATVGLAAIEALVDELESRLTALRAAALDNLDVAVSTRNAVAPDNEGIGNALTQATEANAHAHDIDGRLPLLPAAAGDIPSAATVAAAVEAALVNEGDATALLQAIGDKIAGDLTAGDLTALAIASAVRTNLSTELARIDAAISTRLAESGYTEPDNAGIAAAATSAELVAAKAEIIAAGGGDIGDGVTITQDTLDTDGEALGRVQPYGVVTVYRAGVAEYQFDADADGDFSYALPAGSTWTLISRKAGYRDASAEVAT